MNDVAAGKRAAAEAIRAGTGEAVRVARGAHEGPGLRDVLTAAAAASVPVRTVPREELDRLAPDHRGVVAMLRPGARPAALSERDLSEIAFTDQALVVVLDGVEDPQNLGAAARSAEAAGAELLVTRVRRAAPVTEAAMRASAGSLAHLPHARVANIPRALRRLQAVGFTVVGLDASAPASVHDAHAPDGRVAVVVGSEGAGMSRLVREACDLLVALPMHGRVASLNASASLAAVLYAYVLPRRPGA